VVNCECELERVAPGDVSSPRSWPALGPVLAHVAGVVAELGAALASRVLARERGVPMVLGVHDATGAFGRGDGRGRRPSPA